MAFVESPTIQILKRHLLTDSAEARLAVNIIALAIYDAKDTGARTARRCPNQKNYALNWIRCLCNKNKCFNYWCDVLGVNSDWVASMALTEIKRARNARYKKAA